MMSSILFNTTDWDTIPATQHSGESGLAHWRTIQYEGLRIRLVEYSKGYKADHWCSAGHIVYCLEGEMISELSDGRTFMISKGMSYQVSDNVSQHRSHSKEGVKLLIVEGKFLKPKANDTISNLWKF
ncbi:MAG TPA: DHCW motif cupin fold protein [Chryseolinea sp.]|nr:DHCW motif cupin fold protein [Chryseolinea sp.]HPM28964.1 DHCW motif cupin fold protein [Chryseolinea sp.]